MLSTTTTATAGTSSSSTPLAKGRHTPDLTQPFALSADDEQLLSMRGLDRSRQDAVGAIYSEARSAVRSGQAKSFLSGLDTQSLALLQQAASLAEPVDVGSLTEEGAENLLLAPTEGVDLNGDGLVQTGAAMMFTFPPVDASPALRAAWEKTVAGLDAGDTLMMSMMIGGPMIAVDGSGTRMRDFSGDFDWNGYMADLVAANEAARPYNTPERFQAVDTQLHAFWAALESEGLA